MCNKKRLMFKNYVDCLLKDEIILKLQQRLKSDSQKWFYGTNQ